jgi:hypothetical protein
MATPIGHNNALTVYPNPATNLLYITSMNELRELHIYSLNGMLVKKVTTNEKTFMINISDLPAGFYHIQGKATNGMEQATFIKK